MNMVQDALWELFCDTGDPLCYLLGCALRRMEKYDLENNMELVPTLHAFLLEERNWVNTAARLHIHRNTLRYRIDRIQELTGLDLENPMQRLSLLFAFAVKQYLELFP